MAQLVVTTLFPSPRSLLLFFFSLPSHVSSLLQRCHHICFSLVFSYIGVSLSVFPFGFFFNHRFLGLWSRCQLIVRMAVPLVSKSFHLDSIYLVLVKSKYLLYFISFDLVCKRLPVAFDYVLIARCMVKTTHPFFLQT